MTKRWQALRSTLIFGEAPVVAVVGAVVVSSFVEEGCEIFEPPSSMAVAVVVAATGAVGGGGGGA
jgi:protein-S-isoprenylcysteine O-methyltransferase Ste14